MTFFSPPRILFIAKHSNKYGYSALIVHLQVLIDIFPTQGRLAAFEEFYGEYERSASLYSIAIVLLRQVLEDCRLEDERNLVSESTLISSFNRW